MLSSSSCHTGPAVAVQSVVGRRSYQEDSYSFVPDILGSGTGAGNAAAHWSDRQAQVPEALPRLGLQRPAPAPCALHYAAVFDGHGGSAVSQHCAEQLAPILRQKLQAADAGQYGCNVTDDCNIISDALVQSFKECDISIPVVSASEGGSTAVCAVVGPSRIWVAHCGDSRAVVARSGKQAVALTDDHKPERPDEAARIKAAGGHVFWNGGHRVMGVLSMSRAMGDGYLKQYGVISDPEVMSLERTPDDEFLLLASDGLWASMSNEEAVAMAQKCIARAAERRVVDRRAALRVAAHILVSAAMQKGSSDNITVLLLDLQQPREPVSGPSSPRSTSAVDAMREDSDLPSAPQPMRPPALPGASNDNNNRMSASGSGASTPSCSHAPSTPDAPCSPPSPVSAAGDAETPVAATPFAPGVADATAIDAAQLAQPAANVMGSTSSNVAAVHVAPSSLLSLQQQQQQPLYLSKAGSMDAVRGPSMGFEFSDMMHAKLANLRCCSMPRDVAGPFTRSAPCSSSSVAAEHGTVPEVLQQQAGSASPRPCMSAPIGALRLPGSPRTSAAAAAPATGHAISAQPVQAVNRPLPAAHHRLALSSACGAAAADSTQHHLSPQPRAPAAVGPPLPPIRAKLPAGITALYIPSRQEPAELDSPSLLSRFTEQVLVAVPSPVSAS